MPVIKRLSSLTFYWGEGHRDSNTGIYRIIDMAVAYINFVKVNGLLYINRAARLPKACQSGLD